MPPKSPQPPTPPSKPKSSDERPLVPVRHVVNSFQELDENLARLGRVVLTAEVKRRPVN